MERLRHSTSFSTPCPHSRDGMGDAAVSEEEERDAKDSGNVALVIHSLVQDADNIDVVVGEAVEQDMGP
jgi:hypothetical protein